VKIAPQFEGTTFFFQKVFPRIDQLISKKRKSKDGPNLTYFTLNTYLYHQPRMFDLFKTVLATFQKFCLILWNEKTELLEERQG
jgi:hypothetical protein